MIITIDGPSGTGKTTIAQIVAKRLGLVYFDTGAMYRSAAYLILKNQIDWCDESILKDFLQNFTFEIGENTKEKRYFANGEDVTESIRTPEISQFASLVSTVKILREDLVAKQRLFGKKRASALFEGRDMGSVVFPDAEVKIFLTATDEVRAQRRFKELSQKISVDFETVLQEVKERDHRDSTRAISPLKPADDAIMLDTTHLGIEEVADRIIEIIRSF